MKSKCALLPIACAGHQRLSVAAALMFAVASNPADAVEEHTWKFYSPQFVTWSEEQNWNTTSVPAIGDYLKFTDNGSLLNSTNDFVNGSLGRITFGAGRGTSTISGNAFTLTGDGTANNLGIVNDSSSFMTFNTGIKLQGPADVGFRIAGVVALDGVLSGTAGLVKTGGGTLILGNSNTYTGTTLINQGTISLEGFNGNDFNAIVGDVIVNGGSLDIGFTNENVGAVILNSGSIDGTGNLNGTRYDVKAGTILANLTGAGALDKFGLDEVKLLGNNTYSGPTTVFAGTLTIGGNSIAGKVVVRGGTLNLQNFDEDVGTVQLLSGTIDGSGNLNGTSYAVQAGTIPPT